MKTTAEDLAIINDEIVPLIAGARRFKPFAGPSLHMAYAEMAMFNSILSHAQPECALEIGTETGVTLRLIAKYAKKVISLDIDPAVKAALDGQWPNAELITGSSHALLPAVLQERCGPSGPDFIFVDGDHSAEGVRQDLEHILALTPTRRIIVMMHDSFNPDCRRGMLQARWGQNPFCHFVDLDFVAGVLHPDVAVQRQMWGGLGFALFLPQRRTQPLEIKTTHQLMFEAAFGRSVYAQQFAR